MIEHSCGLVGAEIEARAIVGDGARMPGPIAALNRRRGVWRSEAARPSVGDCGCGRFRGVRDWGRRDGSGLRAGRATARAEDGAARWRRLCEWGLDGSDQNYSWRRALPGTGGAGAGRETI